MTPYQIAVEPAGVLGASVGAIGTSMAQQHLRNILAKDGLFDETA